MNGDLAGGLLIRIVGQRLGEGLIERALSLLDQCRIATAVKTFVIEAILNLVSTCSERRRISKAVCMLEQRLTGPANNTVPENRSSAASRAISERSSSERLRHHPSGELPRPWWAAASERLAQRRARVSQGCTRCEKRQALA